MNLQNELIAIKKVNNRIDVYFQRINQIHDKLSAISV